MNVLYVITRGDAIGGAQVHVLDLSRRLVADGHRVAVAIGSRGPLFEELAAAGVPTFAVPSLQKALHPWRDLQAVREVADVIARVRPDVVSCHSSKAGIVGRLAARTRNVPAVFTAHGWSFTEGVPQPGRLLYRNLERLLAPLAARVVCVSEHDRQLGIAAGIDARHLVTIHNGMPRLDLALRARTPGERPFRLVMVARFEPQKDHLTLFHAIARVPDIHVDLVGDGPTMEDCRILARRLNIEHRVSFLGARRDVPQILAASDGFALISNWEGFPRSTIEAMRAGLPVVVSDVGGAAEAVEPGVTGFVVPRAEVDAVAAAFTRLARDPALRQQMGEAARKRYEERFTFDHMYRRTIDVLETAAQASVIKQRAQAATLAAVQEARHAFKGGHSRGY